jgi:Uncharacterised nucleotidyltransferase
MTEEASFLLAWLQRDRPPAPASLDWDALFLLAESHGVLPLFYRRVTTPPQSLQLPANFVSCFREQWARSIVLAREMRELLGHFANHQIEALPLKGPVLAELLYGHASMRSFDDLDLLVRPKDFPRAESLLLELGFTHFGEENDYHRDYGRNGTFVELHFAVAPPSALSFNLAAAWQRARTAEFQRQPVRVFSPIDRILYLSLHGVKHRFARLVWVLDLAYALDDLSESDATALLDEATAQRLRKLLLTSCEIARRLFHVRLPANIALALQEHSALVRHADAMADDILSGTADPTTSARDASRYLHLADNAGLRWGQRLQFFAPTVQDYQWTARYGVPPSCAVLVRPFRLLCKYGPAPALRTLFSSKTHRP